MKAMPILTEKKITQKMKAIQKRYHHDIQYIDGRFVEDVVKEYQQTKNEDLLLKIIDNYQIFAKEWAYNFSHYCDNSLEAGEAMFKELIWYSATKFNSDKSLKANGKAFNAYWVSAALHRLKNFRSQRMSHKNSPRCTCPVCNQLVFQVDAKHLKHVIDLERYRRTFPKYPLVSTDGAVTCPISGKYLDKINDTHLNKVNGSYRVEDFEKDYPHLLPKYPLVCPATLNQIKHLDSSYPSMIESGYTEKAFINDFPDFAGIIRCPFSAKKILGITQEHLDKVLSQKHGKARLIMPKFKLKYPNITLKARQVPVLNPYTNKMVPEITPAMLSDAGTTVMDHINNHPSICLDDYYPDMIICPFTGRRTHKITKEDLKEINRKPIEFYFAVCKYPMKKWQIRCACCGDWVDNIWTHLEQAQHTYAQSMTMEDFEKAYGTASTKIVVSTNAFYDNEEGDSVHVADLMVNQIKNIDPLEIEDSLMAVAENDLDRRIAGAMRGFETLDDICYTAAKKRKVRLPMPFEAGNSRIFRDIVRKKIKEEDFDFSITPQDGAKKIEIMIPGRDTIRTRLLHLIQSSDLDELVKATCRKKSV